jgi:WhiB family redox-sensing transcriptional regulator
MSSPRRGLTSTHGTSTGQDDPYEGAPCRTVDPETFFPDGRGVGIQYVRYLEAKTICGPCPARPECLKGALQRRESWGVWGGELFDGGRVIHPKRPRTHTATNGEAA